MKILLVTHYFPGHGGGIEKAAGALARRLAVTDEIRWVASDVDVPPAEVTAFPAPAWNGIEKSVGLAYPIWYSPAARLLRENIAWADVVHVHEYPYSGSLLAVRIAKRLGKPVLLTQHVGDVPHRNPFLRMTIAVMNRNVGRHQLARADRVSFISSAVRDYFAAFTHFRAAPLLIPNGIDGAIYRPKERKEKKKRTVVFVGRFVPRKGLPLLKRLAEALPTVQWIFAGQGPLDPERWGFPHVEVVRNASGSSVADLYRAADLFVLPSWGEGLPLVLQETLSCGTAALVSPETAAAWPDLRAHVYSEPLDFSRWKNRITNLLETPEKLSRAGRDAARFAKSQWDAEHAASAYREVLSSLCDSSISAKRTRLRSARSRHSASRG